MPGTWPVGVPATTCLLHSNAMAVLRREEQSARAMPMKAQTGKHRVARATPELSTYLGRPGGLPPAIQVFFLA